MDLFLVAGEPSADLHGAHLIEALLKQQPDLQIGAVAGIRMRSLPIITLFSMEELQVMGFIDVLVELPHLVRFFYRVRDEILRLQPKVVLSIDYPGFNLRLARSLKKEGYQGRLIHYICPTVWAWGKGRIPLMAKYLDRLLTLFPFERDCFTHTALPVAYVGHPLVSQVARHQSVCQFPGKILALFPGSRKGEILKNFPLQKEVALRLKKLFPDLQVIVSCANETVRPLLSSPFPVVEHSYDLMRSAHLALATSGTVTLELALFQVPTVVHYAIRPFDCFLAQKIFRIHLPHYCIVNIIAQRRIFPELFGPHLTVETLFEEAIRYWSDPEVRSVCREGLDRVRHLLGEKDASAEAAEQVMQLLAF